MSEFTKGEWEIMPYTRRDSDNIRWVKAIRGKKHITICQTFKPNAEANARLIASVQGLLTACEEYAKGVMLLRESDNEIMLGAALQLQKADGLGIAAIKKAQS